MRGIITLLFGATLLCAAPVIKMNAEQKGRLGVVVEHPQAVEEVRYGPFSAKVLIDKEDIFTINANISGSVEAIYVKNSQAVKAGEVLFKIRSAELIELQNSYLSAFIQNDLYRKNYERDQALFDEGIISHKRLLETKALKESSDVALDIAKNRLLVSGFHRFGELEEQKRAFSEEILRAPRAGYVEEVSVNVKENIDARTKLALIYSSKSPYLEINVPSKYIERVQQGERVDFDAKEAIVESSSHAMDVETQSFRLRAKITDSSKVIVNKVHQAYIYKKVQNAFSIQKSAVVFHKEGSFIFKSTQDGFEAVEVQRVREEADYIVVSGRLSATDLIATKATSALLSAMEASSE
ncbi:MAG: efflux RND transporter periplasmic adaptor subunit [Epsilonproteobacteria bacterium]|nr:efflux RND transporter periplasmic adaptor subunit [Campylobacterota bacterium]